MGFIDMANERINMLLRSRVVLQRIKGATCRSINFLGVCQVRILSSRDFTFPMSVKPAGPYSYFHLLAFSMVFNTA